jgi:hypothetical protein
MSEIARRCDAAGFTLEAIADGHAPELAFMRETARWIVAMCSRRAGKTLGIGGRYAKRSMAVPRGNRIYLALTGGQARDVMWEPIWKPMCERWRLPVEHNETRMVSTFENGSRVRMAGTDDIQAIKKELGAGLDEACVDEAQDQKDNVLRDLCIRILPPALTDRRGTLLVSGVVPEVASGYFWELWKLSNWAKHNWSQMDNPHLPHAMAELMEYLEKNPGLTEESPVIQRERFGRFVYDKNVTAYTYSQELNGRQPECPPWLEDLFGGDIPDYLAPAMRAAKLDSLRFCHWTKEPLDGTARFGVMATAPHEGITQFAGAIDPGTGDRASFNVVGWGETTQEVQHVFEWSAPRKAATTLGQLAAWMVVANQHYPTDGNLHWDPGSGRMEIDTFQGDYGLPILKAAGKSETAGQIRRVNDLLTSGYLTLMVGSATEQDMQKARRDPNAPSGGPWKWASGWHPDPAESLRYAVGGYFSAYVEPEPETPYAIAKRKAAALKVKRQAAMRRGLRLQEDEEARVMGGARGSYEEDEDPLA